MKNELTNWLKVSNKLFLLIIVVWKQRVIHSHLQPQIHFIHRIICQLRLFYRIQGRLLCWSWIFQHLILPVHRVWTVMHQNVRRWLARVNWRHRRCLWCLEAVHVVQIARNILWRLIHLLNHPLFQPQIHPRVFAPIRWWGLLDYNRLVAIVFYVLLFRQKSWGDFGFLWKNEGNWWQSRFILKVELNLLDHLAFDINLIFIW